MPGVILFISDDRLSYATAWGDKGPLGLVALLMWLGIGLVSWPLKKVFEGGPGVERPWKVTACHR